MALLYDGREPRRRGDLTMVFFTRLGAWVRALTRPRAAERDLEREVRLHIEMEAESLMQRGVEPNEARRQAALTFGAVQRFKEEVRDEYPSRLLDDLLADVRFAFRSYRRSALFSAMALVVLGVGIGGGTTLATLAGHALYRPLPYPEAGRVVYATEASDRGEELPVSFPNFSDWRDRARTLTAVTAATSGMDESLVVDGNAVKATTQMVTRNFFPLFGVRPVVGRAFAAEETAKGGPAVAIVSESFWRGQLSAKSLTGLTFKRGGEVHVVVGVLPTKFRGPVAADVWVPLERASIDIRGAGNYMVYARLVAGSSLGAAQAELSAIAKDLKRQYGDESVSSAVAMKPLLDHLVGGARRPLVLLLVAAMVLLLATCASIAMMQVSRGTARAREMSIRASLGASRGRIVRQLITEQLALALGGALLGLLVTWVGMGAAHRYGAALIPRIDEVHASSLWIAVAVGVTVTAVLIFGTASVGHTVRSHRASLVTTERVSSGSRRQIDRVLVGLQAAATVLLLGGAAILVRGITRVFTADVGYSREGLMRARVPMMSTRYEDLQQRLRMASALIDSLGSIPGVQGVALASQLPHVFGGNNGPVMVPPFGDPQAQSSWATTASLRVVTRGYFALLKIPLLRGRLLGTEDGATSKAVVVNRALADKVWPGRDPLGQQIRGLVDNRADTFTVVGVVGNARAWWAEPGAQRDYYLTVTQRPEFAWQLNAVVQTSSPNAVAPEIVRRIRALDPEVIPDVQTLDGIVGESIADRTFIAGLIGVFSVVVLMLTIAGVFGAVSYAVERRTREIGLRMAMGAPRGTVWRMVQGEIWTAAVVGCIAGIVASMGANRLLANLLFEVSPQDPFALGGAAFLALASIGLAAAIPALRAMRIDAVQALRTE